MHKPITFKYQLYFGQADTGKKDTTVWDLGSNSKEVKLSYLKSCTTYAWNLKSLRNDKWAWEWSNDRMFTTGGNCPGAVATGATVTASTGTKVKVIGTASATATWSVTNGAESYNVYYRPANETKYIHAVKVPSGGTSVTINYLGSATYYYRVAALVAGKEVWQAEKMLKAASGMQVQGITSYQMVQPKVSLKQPEISKVAPKVGKTAPRIGGGQVAGTTMQDSSMKKGWATVSWTNPGSISKYHVYYWSANTDQHALRNLDSSANRVTISGLNPNRTYWYRVQAIGHDGKAKWLSDAKSMMMY